MPRVNIDGIIVLTYDMSPKDRYWTSLSQFIIDKHGAKVWTEHSKVEEILLDGFNFLTNQFRTILLPEATFTFYKYVFWLHEQSIELMFKTQNGYKQTKMAESDLARYRRILKLILEQGCDVDMEWGKPLNPSDVFMLDNKIQDLIYIGTWIYEFADYIAYHKMVQDYHYIRFNDNHWLVIDWQYHFGEAYNQLLPLINDDYVHATFDEQSMEELRTSIETCFGIDYDYAGGIIFHLKEHHSPDAPLLQTIEPYVLPINLAHQCAITKEDSETFYKGLSISRDNKLTIEQAVYKPQSTDRYMFRPILIYRIEGVERALVGKQKFIESMYVLATNAIHWNAILKEWMTNKCMELFIQRKGAEHDKILEDKIEEILKEKDLLYCRNQTSFKQMSGTNYNFEREAGEIDFIIINRSLKKVFVADAKYIRAKYEGVGYGNDYSKFIGYENQIERKSNWIAKNLKLVQEHLKIVKGLADLDILDFEVEGVFLINTPTFYMFNGKYKSITLKQAPDYIEGNYPLPKLRIVRLNKGKEQISYIEHPYFKKPM